MISLGWIEIGAGAVVGAILAGFVVWPIAHHSGVSEGRSLEQAAARTRAVDLIQKRSEDNAEITKLDAAGLCAELGGRWVPDEDRCD